MGQSRSTVFFPAPHWNDNCMINSYGWGQDEAIPTSHHLLYEWIIEEEEELPSFLASENYEHVCCFHPQAET